MGKHDFAFSTTANVVMPGYAAFVLQGHSEAVKVNEVAECALVDARKCFVGCASGALYVYNAVTNDLIDSRPALSAKPIQQLSVIKETNSLVCLSDGNLTLYDLDDFSVQFNLTKTTQYFKIHTSTTPDNKLRSILLVASRRKLHLFQWIDAQWITPSEMSLPHQIRHIAFTKDSHALVAYSTGEYATVDCDKATITEYIVPLFHHTHTQTIQGLDRIAKSVGFNKSTLQWIIPILGSGLVILIKDTLLILTQLSNPDRIVAKLELPLAITEEPIFRDPYILLPHSSQTSGTHVAVFSLISSEIIQTFTAPYHKATLATSKLVSVMSQKTSILQDVRMVPLENQLSALLDQAQYVSALKLLDKQPAMTVDPVPQDLKRKVLILRALQLFGEGGKADNYEKALDMFTELNVASSKVISLYGEDVAGTLSKAQEDWPGIFGLTVPNAQIQAVSDKEKEDAAAKESAPSIKSTTSRPASPQHSTKSSDTSSQASIAALMRYIPDQRQKLLQAISKLRPTQRPTPSSPPATVDPLTLPDLPYTDYSPDQLATASQVVETALLKCYLIKSPALLGSLCRIENWVVIEEVEGALKEADKLQELLALCNTKKRHDKALDLLKIMSEAEEDPKERVEPTIQYLKGLDKRHLDLVFTSAEWVHQISPETTLSIFTADSEESESLPRHDVAYFLRDKISSDICLVYLEHIISMGETGREFHEMTAEILLSRALGSTDESPKVKLITFLGSSAHYRPERLLARLPEKKMYEVRAILQGKLGNHESALSIYVYRLQDYSSAERYCVSAYSQEPEIFLMLLKLYLAPRPGSSNAVTSSFMEPALNLLNSQATNFPTPESILQLLPPLITLEELQSMLVKSLRHQICKSNALKVGRGISRSKLDDLERETASNESKRVLITDSRLCPACYKRLGNSVIAIHAPAGQVTHYQCRERFQEMQNRKS